MSGMSPSYFHLHLLHGIAPMIAYVLHLAQSSNLRLPQGNASFCCIHLFTRGTIGWST